MTAASKRKVLYGVIIALAVLHHDFWFWHDRTLVFGFVPIGLFYHGLYSFAAAAAWGVLMKYAWPTEVEDFGHGEKEAPPQA